MKKLLTVLFVVAFLTTSMFAVKVGFIATNFSSEAQARVANEFAQICDEKGWELVQLNSMGSIETQSTQLENLVMMNVDAIIMAMSHPNEIKSSLEKAFEAGIPVITIDSGYVDGVVCDITSDNFVMGAKMSTYLMDSLGGNGNIVIIKFQKHYGTRRRGKVLDVVLSEYPGIKVLSEYGVAATQRFMDDTRSAMETFALKYGDQIDGVWCAFDQLAYAAADILAEYGYDDVLVVGADGNEETFRRIANGNMTATVAQPFEEMAREAATIVEKIASGVDPMVAAGRKIIYAEAQLIDIKNLPK